MNKSNSITNIGDVYGKMLTEAKDKMVIGDAPLKEGGPQEKGGFKPASIDKRKKGDKSKENAYKVGELSNDDNLEEDEETPAKKKDVVVEKVATRSLNKFMAKSIFDKLYESAMGPDFNADPGAGAPDAGMDDLDADGLDLDAEGEGEGEDEVTISLDRATAEKLRDVLNAILDTGEEGLEDEGLGEGEGDAGLDESEPEWYDEDEETKGAPKPASKSVDSGKNNKVGNLKPSGGGASNAKPTDKVGNDGDYGHALHGAKKPNMGDKSNKVGNYTPGKRLFDK